MLFPLSFISKLHEILPKYYTHMVKTGSRRLKLFNVCKIPVTTLSLVVYRLESVKIFFLQALLKVLVLIVC